MEKWRAVVNTVMNLWAPLCGEFLDQLWNRWLFTTDCVPWNQFEIRMLNVTRKYIIEWGLG